MREGFAYPGASSQSPEKKAVEGGLVGGAALGMLSGKKASMRIKRGVKLGALGALLGLVGSIGYNVGQRSSERGAWSGDK